MKINYILLSIFIIGCNNADNKNSPIVEKRKLDTTFIQRMDTIYIKKKNSTKDYVGKWVVKDYYFSNNISGLSEKEAHLMLNTSPLRVYDNFIVDIHDSCYYNSIKVIKVNADSFLSTYEFQKKDLKLDVDSFTILSFRKKEDPDNLKNECATLNNEIILLKDNFLINIEGVFFKLSKSN